MADRKLQPSAARPRRALRIARIGVAVAFLAGLIPLLGWTLNVPLLTPFDSHSMIVWPPTALGIMLTAAGLVVTLESRRRWVAWCPLAVATVIGIAALLGVATGVTSGFDRLTSAAPGRAGLTSGLLLILLPPLIALAGLRSRVAGRIVVLTASLLLGFGMLFLVLFVPASAFLDVELRSFWTPLPTAIAAVGLSIALLAMRAESGWAGLLGNDAPNWCFGRLAFPAILLVPVGVSLTELWFERSGMLTQVPADMITVGLNVLVVAFLLFWSTNRAARQSTALRRLTSALDVAPIALTDPDGRIVHWSRGCEELYGWSSAEALGRSKRGLLNTRHVAARAHADDRRDEEELTETTRDGRVRHVIERVRKVETADGSSLLVLSMTDIDARVRAEAALRESETRLSLAMSAHPMGSFEYDVAADRLTWSPGSEERLGIEPGSFNGFEKWSALVLEEDLGKLLAAMADARERKVEQYSVYYRFRSADGTIRSIEGSTRCLYDEAGRWVRDLGVSIDVTARDEREAALRAREAIHLSVLDTVPDAMVVIDEQGVIYSFSRAAEQLFGYMAGEAVGQNVSLLMSSPDAAMHHGFLARDAASGDAGVIGQNRRFTARRADGREIPVEIFVGEAIVGEKRFFTGFIRDISSRLAADEALATLSAQLAQASRLTAMGELAAGLAQQLNQPLAAATNYVGTARILLAQGADRAPIAELLDQAGSHSLRAGEIVRRLREFVTERETEPSSEPVEATLREAAALASVGQGQFDIQLRFALDPDARLMFADRLQVQQVVVNLLRNSIEALELVDRRGREICVAARAIGAGTLEIGVTDNGPGIAPSVLAGNERPFSSRPAAGGLGLGLSISRRIVEAHGGRLTIGNRPEGGAWVRFTLPMFDGATVEGD